LEYTISAGIIEDAKHNLLSRANFNYGLSRRITIGGGVEYNSTVITGMTMPFLNFSLRLGAGLLISGEYTYDVRFKGFLSYRLPHDLQFEFNYLRYKQDQRAISSNLLEERKAVLSMPFHGPHFASLVRLTVDQMILPRSRNFTTELLLSGSVYGVSANLTTYGMFFDPAHPYIYSTLSLGFRLPARISLTPRPNMILIMPGLSQ